MTDTYNGYDAKHWHDLAANLQRRINDYASAIDAHVVTIERSGAVTCDDQDATSNLRDITVMLQSGELKIEAVEPAE